jgi:hypothetical protein
LAADESAGSANRHSPPMSSFFGISYQGLFFFASVAEPHMDDSVS